MWFGLLPLKDICEDPVNLVFTIHDGIQSAYLLLQLLHLTTSKRTHLPQVRPPSPPTPGRGTRHSVQPKTWKATSSLLLSRTHMYQGHLLQQLSPCGTSPFLLYSLKQSHTICSRASEPLRTPACFFLLAVFWQLRPRAGMKTEYSSYTTLTVKVLKIYTVPTMLNTLTSWCNFIWCYVTRLCRCMI